MKRTLTESLALRGGSSAKRLDVVPNSLVSIGTATPEHALQGITLQTTIPSKGGGDTVVQIFIPAADFVPLAETMMAANPQRALAAFNAATRRLQSA